MRGQHRIVVVLRKEDHAACALGGHGGDDRIGRVEHGVTRGCHVHHDHALEHREVFYRGDVVQAQVVAGTHVGHHRHAALVKTQALAQHAAACGFEHGGVHIGVHQHVSRALRAGTITAVDLSAIHIHTIGVGHAHAQAAGGHEVRNEAGGGGLAVGAGDRNQRDAAVIAGFKHVRHHRLAHRAALAVRRR